MRTVKISGTDISLFAVCLPNGADPAEKTAAEFLQRVIKASCGVELPIAENFGHAIRLGGQPYDPEIRYDGYRTVQKGDDLYIYGNLPRGTLYGAYGFAEEFLGYRAFSPDCEVMATDGDIAVETGYQKLDCPAFEMRLCSNVKIHRDRSFGSRCRINGYGTPGDDWGGKAPMKGGHSFARLCPSAVYFDEHPEYFSLFEGRRIPGGNEQGPVVGQLCLTNPEVLKIVTENVLSALRAEEDPHIVDVSQNDNSRYCRCENCAASDAAEGGPTGTLIRFVNAVAQAVEKEFPNVLVQTFAYQYTREAPKVTRARHNVLVRYCTIEACFRHSLDDPRCKLNSGVFYRELLDWQKMADNLYIYDYVVNYRCYVAPFPNLYSLWKNAGIFADCHARYIYESDTASAPSAACSDLRGYLIGKLLWDPRMSREKYEEHIVGFLKAYYGPGWRYVGEYLKLEHETTRDYDMTCFEWADIANAFDAPFGNIGEYMAGEYLPKAYQAHHPKTYLNGFIEHIGEALELWDKAYALAENGVQRDRITLGKMAAEYIDLFNTPHDKKTMSEEEKIAYESRVADYLEIKEKFGLRYNLWTVRYNGR